MTAIVTAWLLVTCVVFGTSYNVDNVPGKRWDVVSRFKRSKLDKRGFTQVERKQLLDLHNEYRRVEPATDMRLMEWDNNLAYMAQKWADRCVWTHSTSGRKNVPNFGYVGENLYAFTDVPTPTQVVKDWVVEKRWYDFFTGRCSNVCGHYTQVVWAESYALGCGIRFCSSIQHLESWQQYGGGYVVVCNYGPGGNIVGRQPYIRGSRACSACSSDFPYCQDTLCSHGPSSGVLPIPGPHEPHPGLTLRPYRLPPGVSTTPRTITVTSASASRPCFLIGGYAGMLLILMQLLL